MVNEKAPPNARVAASQCHPRPGLWQGPTFSTRTPEPFKRAIDMTDDELAAIVAKARLTVVK